jgi:hypothetical protein
LDKNLPDQDNSNQDHLPQNSKNQTPGSQYQSWQPRNQGKSKDKNPSGNIQTKANTKDKNGTGMKTLTTSCELEMQFTLYKRSVHGQIFIFPTF